MNNLPELASLKRKFNNQLEPLKVMLVHRRDSMPKDKWIKFVYTTRMSILENPDQYLDLDTGLPPQAVIATLIGQIFEEFLNRELNER